MNERTQTHTNKYGTKYVSPGFLFFLLQLWMTSYHSAAVLNQRPDRERQGMMSSHPGLVTLPCP